MTSRILPVRIHDLDSEDRTLLENELGLLRSIDLIFKSTGVNRPLKASDDDRTEHHGNFYYRNQINKVANAVKELIVG